MVQELLTEPFRQLEVEYKALVEANDEALSARECRMDEKESTYADDEVRYRHNALASWENSAQRTEFEALGGDLSSA